MNFFFKNLFKPFRMNLGIGTPVRDLPMKLSDLPIDPEIKSIEDLKRILKQPSPAGEEAK